MDRSIQPCRDLDASRPDAGAVAARLAGARSVDRALTVLTVVAETGVAGLGLGALARRAGLDPATTHRLLASLMRFGFVEQDPRSRHYHLGLEFFSVAAAASNRHDLSAGARIALDRLRQTTEATALFLLMSGIELVCLSLRFGTLPTSSIPQDLGSRWPLGAGAAGIACLADFPDTEAERLAIASVRRFSPDPEAAVRVIRAGILRTRRTGFAIEIDRARGLATLAVAVRDPGGAPAGALAINGPVEHLGGRRAGHCAGLLAEAARSLSTVASSPQGISHREISFGT